MIGSFKWCLFGVVGAFISGCASTPSLVPPAVPAASVTAGQASASALARAARVARLVDRRPEALTRDSGPHIESHYSVLVVGGTGGAFINGARAEGAFHYGDPERFSATLVDGLVSGVIGSGGDRPQVRADTLASGDAQRLARELGISDGVVVVPVLDQFDMSQLSSVNAMQGGSDYEVGRSATTVTTRQTSGAAALGSRTPSWINLRVRLLVLELRAGAPISARWVYGRGHAGAFPDAYSGLATSLRDGLETVLSPRPAPPSESAPSGDSSTNPQGELP